MRPLVVLLGDSITERGFVFSMRGWGLQLASWYGVKADVINRGHSGYSTRIAMELLEERKEGWYHQMDGERAANLVVIFWGANDAALGGLQGIPVEEYKSRLHEQIQRVRSIGREYSVKVLSKKDEYYTKVIVVTPPPVDDEAWLKAMKERSSGNGATQEELDKITLDRDNKTTASYAEAAKEIANQCGCPVIDLYSNMQEKLPKNETTFGAYFSDGLHFSSQGNDFLFDALRRTIKQNIPEMAPVNITKDFLEWRDAIEAFEKKEKS